MKQSTTAGCAARQAVPGPRDAGNRRRGSILIIVVGVLTMLTIAVSTFVVFAQVNFRATVARNYTLRMDLLLNGILQQIRMTLAKDLEETQEPFDHPRWDPWLASSVDEGDNWRYVSRLDLADAGKAGPSKPASAALISSTQAAPWNSLTGNNLHLANDTYLDADGDNMIDSLMLPVAGTSQYPDSVRPFYAVRITDNASFNMLHHHKWERNVNGITAPCNTDGRVIWTPGMPKLPHVNLRGLRNYTEKRASPSDNPDRAPDMTVADPDGTDHYDNDRLWDRILGTDDQTILVDPEMPRIPFTLDDEIDLKSFGNIDETNKFLLAWPHTFTLKNNSNDRFRRTNRRIVSMVSRFRTANWMLPPGAAAGATPSLMTKFDLRRLFVHTPGTPAAANHALNIPRMDELFRWLQAKGILQTDDKRAQWLANLYEYWSPTGGADDLFTYPPIVYRGKVGVTRQPFITEIVRQGDPAPSVTLAGRLVWNTRLAIELFNPYDQPLNLLPYTLRIRSDLPANNTFGFTGGSIVEPQVVVNFPAVQIPAYGFYTLATDGSGDAALPAGALRVGPRILVTLERDIPTVGTVLYDVFDARQTALTSTGTDRDLDWRDWDRANNGAQQADWIAAVNNGWVVPLGGTSPLAGTQGRRSCVYRPMGDRLSGTTQYPSYMTAEFVGLATTTQGTSAIAGATSYGYMRRFNRNQRLDSYNLPVVDGSYSYTGASGATEWAPFIFGYSIPLPKRGDFVNVGEIARALVVGNTTGTSFSTNFAAASLVSRTNPLNWGVTGNSWAWLNGERALRFDIMDPTADPTGKPYANSRILDIVSLYHHSAGNGTEWQPITVTAAATELDDTSDDAVDTTGDGQRRPAYREGLINVNTAGARVLQNLVFPRAHRTGDRVTNGNNFTFGRDLHNWTQILGNHFESNSDVLLWSKSSDVARFADTTFNFSWDMPLSVNGNNESSRGSVQEIGGPFGEGYPSHPDPIYTTLTPAWRTCYLRAGYANDMAERDMLWAGNSNVVSVRADVFTVWITVKLVRGDPLVAGFLEDLGSTRLIAIIDRTNCNPLTSPTSPNPVLPRVLIQQIVE